MKTKYRVYQSCLDPQQRSIKQPLFYVRTVAKGVKNLEQLCEEVMGGAAARSEELQGAMHMVFRQAMFWMKAGYDIHLDNWGCFSMLIKNKVPISPKGEISNQQIAFKRVKYRPAPMLRDYLDQTQFEKLSVKPHNTALPDKRCKLILQLFDQKTFITADDCCKVNNCARSTALRDLNFLIETQCIQRMGFGAAVLYQKVKP